MNTAGDEKIAGAFGGGFNEHGGLDFDKAVFVEVVAGNFGYAVTHKNVSLKVGPAQVEIAVFKSKLLFNIRVFHDFKGRGLRKAQHLKLGYRYFHLTGGNVLVYRRTAADGACCGKHKFRSDLKGLVEDVLFGAVVKGKLAYTCTVAKVDKNELTEIPLALYPSAYRHGLSFVCGTKLAAVNGAVHISQKFGVKHFKLSLHIFNALLHGGKGVVKGVAVKFFYNVGNVNVTLL